MRIRITAEMYRCTVSELQKCLFIYLIKPKLNYNILSMSFDSFECFDTDKLIVEIERRVVAVHYGYITFRLRE